MLYYTNIKGSNLKKNDIGVNEHERLSNITIRHT